jgi:hypothetical protein
MCTLSFGSIRYRRHWYVSALVVLCSPCCVLLCVCGLPVSLSVRTSGVKYAAPFYVYRRSPVNIMLILLCMCVSVCGQASGRCLCWMRPGSSRWRNGSRWVTHQSYIYVYINKVCMCIFKKRYISVCKTDFSLTLVPALTISFSFSKLCLSYH